MSKLVGSVSLLINGEKLNSQPGASIVLGGFTRTPQKGSDRIAGDTEEIDPCVITATFNVALGDDIVKLNQTRDADATFLCDNGIVLTSSEVFSLGDGELSDGGGGLSLTFNGQPAKKG